MILYSCNMRTLVTISASLLLYLSAFQSSYSSCSKKTSSDAISNTNNKECNPVSLEIITANEWIIQENRGVVGGSMLYYLRGNSTNTESFNKEYIAFNADKTGTNVYNDGNQTTFTWEFANDEQTKIIWTVRNTPATFSITWDNIRYKNNSLYFDEYYTDGNTGMHSHTQQIRIPK